MAIAETSGDSMEMISDTADTAIEDTSAAGEISADVWEDVALEETFADSMVRIFDEEDTSNGELDTASPEELSEDVPKVLGEITIAGGSADPGVTD